MHNPESQILPSEYLWENGISKVFKKNSAQINSGTYTFISMLFTVETYITKKRK